AGGTRSTWPSSSAPTAKSSTSTPKSSDRHKTAPHPGGWGAQLMKKALLQGVPPPAGGGITCDFVISGGVYVGNDTSHEILADNFARNRGQNFVRPNSKKRLCRFFDT